MILRSECCSHLNKIPSYFPPPLQGYIYQPLRCGTLTCAQGEGGVKAHPLSPFRILREGRCRFNLLQHAMPQTPTTPKTRQNDTQRFASVCVQGRLEHSVEYSTDTEQSTQEAA